MSLSIARSVAKSLLDNVSSPSADHFGFSVEKVVQWLISEKGESNNFFPY